MSAERDLLRRCILHAKDPASFSYSDNKLLQHDIGILLSLPEPETFKPDWDNYRQGVADTKLELRDHFAGLAMQGFLSSDADLIDQEKDISEWSYSQADAMMIERDKHNQCEGES